MPWWRKMLPPNFLSHAHHLEGLKQLTVSGHCVSLDTSCVVEVEEFCPNPRSLNLLKRHPCESTQHCGGRSSPLRRETQMKQNEKNSG